MGELAKLLGYSGDVIKTIDKAQEDDPSLAMSFFKAGKQNVVLMLGIQGKRQDYCDCEDGKVAHKAWLQGGSHWCRYLASGALTQLKMNCSKINVEVFGEEQNNNAVTIARNGLAYFKDQNTLTL